MKRIALILVLGAALSACATTQQQNAAVKGGAIGAAAGALIGYDSGNTVEGAVVGGALGATAGAVLAAPRDYQGHRHYYQGYSEDEYEHGDD